MPLVVRLPRNPEVLRTLGRYPRALNVFDGRQTAVQRQLRRSGLAGYQPLAQAALLAAAQRAPRDSAFYEVGAHIGFYSALINAVTGRRGPAVYAFEPSPAVADIARRLRDANGLDYQVLERAVAAEPGTTRLRLPSGPWGPEGSGTRGPAGALARGRPPAVRVPVTTLDEFTAEQRLAPGLIKIDERTPEAGVLDGALETIRANRPWIVCELPQRSRRALRTALARVLDLDYRLYPIQPETPWPARTPEDYRALAGSQHRHWLLAPRRVGGGWYRDMRLWLIAILACDERTNISTAEDAALPRRWNTAYHAPLRVPAQARSLLRRFTRR
jgi:FkbM family methyltransferase